MYILFILIINYSIQTYIRLNDNNNINYNKQKFVNLNEQSLLKLNNIIKLNSDKQIKYVLQNRKFNCNENLLFIYKKNAYNSFDKEKLAKVEKILKFILDKQINYVLENKIISKLSKDKNLIDYKKSYRLGYSVKDKINNENYLFNKKFIDEKYINNYELNEDNNQKPDYINQFKEIETNKKLIEDNKQKLNSTYINQINKEFNEDNKQKSNSLYINQSKEIETNKKVNSITNKSKIFTRNLNKNQNEILTTEKNNEKHIQNFLSFDEQFLKKEKIKYNIIIDENFLHNIYKSDYFKEFINVFFIIEKDLFTILKNAYFYIYYGNELIADILNKFNTEKTLIERISLFLDVLKKLENFNTFNMNILNDEKSLLIENCLKNHFYKSYENNKVLNKTKSSLSKFRQRLIRQIFDLSEVLIYLSKILNEIPDRNFHALVLYGLQNIFNNDSYLNLPRFLNVVTTLYTYKNERNLYSVN